MGELAEISLLKKFCDHLILMLRGERLTHKKMGE